MIYKQNGIIIKSIDFGEADKIIIILTQEKGCVKTIAKGARKPTSKKTASIDLGIFAKFSLAEGKNFDVITELSPIYTPEKIKENIKKAAFLYYALEMTDKFFTETEQGSEIFEDLANFIKQLDQEEDQTKFLKLLTIYEALLLHKSGFLRNIIDTNNSNKTQVRDYKILKYFSMNNFNECLKLKLGRKDLERIFADLYKQTIEILERDLKSYKFLSKIIKEL